MSFVDPLAGLLLAALVIPPLVLLYFLKLRRKPQAIATTLLWRKAVEDLQANAPFQRLRRSVLLLLQLVVLLLLALAIMQPQLESGGRAGARTIVIVDNSASMSATDTEDGRTRLEHAKDAARAFVEQLHGGGWLGGGTGETMIVAFNETAQVLSRFTSSRQEQLAATDAIQPVDAGTRIEEALKLARAYTTNPDPESDRPIDDPAIIELFSDGRIEDLADQVKKESRWTYHVFGAPEPDNVAIASISVERPYDRPTMIEVFAGLVSYNERPVTCDVQLAVDNTAIKVETVEIPAATRDPARGTLVPSRANIVFSPFEQPRGAVVSVENTRPDDLLVDNTAQLVVAPPKQLRLAIVAPKSYVLREALSGMPLERIDVLSAAEFAALAADRDEIDEYDVVVLDDHAVERLPAGRYLTFGATPPVEGLNEYGTGEVMLILDIADEQPAMRFVPLDSLYISRYVKIRPDEDVLVLAEGTDAPAVVSLSRGGLELVHVTFSPLDSNWPFLRSFVTFLYNAVEALGHSGDAVTSASLRAGEALTTRLPADARDVEILPPDASVPVRLAPEDPTELSWGPIRRAGVHVLTWSRPGVEGREARSFAVNLLSETEGDLRPAERMVFGEDEVVGESPDAVGYTSLWPWAIGLALAMLMFEWWVYHRKVLV